MSDEKRKTITLSGNFIEITQDETDSEIQTDFETKPLTVKTNDIKKGTKINYSYTSQIMIKMDI